MDSRKDVYARALEFAYELHHERDPSAYGATLLRGLGGAIPCDSAVLATVDVEGGSYRIEAWPDGHFARIDPVETMRLHAADHPFVAHCRTSRSANAYRLVDLAPREAFQRTGLYTKLYRFLGIEHQLAMLVASPGKPWRAIALNRKATEFSDEERGALESLWPHITLAQRNLRRSQRMRDPGLPDLQLDAAAGVMVIRANGDVTLSSERARIWMTEYFGAVFVGRSVALPAPLRAWALARIEAETHGKRLRLVRLDHFHAVRGEHCLVADLIVDHGKDQHLLRLEETVLNAPPATLEGLGLTPREAEVLCWVAQGKTNREIGMILSSSARTVQKHLEHVFEKIGVENRTAAILRAWQAGRHASLA
jgi:DNA-binding CsgD family transcriptional regulator